MFSHIKALEVSADNTSTYEFSDILVNGVSPAVIVCPAGEANKPYHNEILKTQANNAASAARGKINRKQLQENRDEDRRLFPIYVIVGFVEGTVLDEKGEPVEYSTDVAKQFVQALPNDMFDRLRHFCSTPDNFRGEVIDATDKAKN